MKTQTPCPKCQAPMTFGRLMLASTPWSLRCKACCARFGDTRLTVLLLATYTVVVVAIGVWLFPLRQVSRIQFYALLLAIAIFGEAIGCLALLRWGKFVLKSPRTSNNG